MGCASSKRVDAVVAADIYRPPPTSFALFDINTIEEPWLITTTTTMESNTKEQQEQDEKKPTTHMPLPLLEKLESYDLAPQSWSEVSKALEDLKPTLHQLTPPPPKPQSFHTLKDLDSPRPPPPEIAGFRPVKENSFVLRDRQERENNKSTETAITKWKRRDPLDGYPVRCPPGNPDGVVLYTTTLRGVRRTFEDCELARRVVETNAVDAGVQVDERDVSLHGEFLKEVRELVVAGESSGVPRLFIRGRYVGGIEEMVEMNESGKMREIMRWVAIGGGGGGGGKIGCEGCGGARFVPCLECSGSCKVLGEDGKGVVRCSKCNENGLVLCPLCH